MVLIMINYRPWHPPLLHTHTNYARTHIPRTHELTSQASEKAGALWEDIDRGMERETETADNASNTLIQNSQGGK